jgi:hypothetical protein
MSDVEIGFGLFVGLWVLFFILLYVDRKRML